MSKDPKEQSNRLITQFPFVYTKCCTWSQLKPLLWSKLKKGRSNDQILRAIPNKDKIIFIGDLNAWVDQLPHTRPNFLVKFETKNANTNDNLVLSISTEKQQAITNTYLKNNEIHKKSYLHTRSKHCEYIAKRNLQDFLNTKETGEVNCSIHHMI